MLTSLRKQSQRKQNFSQFYPRTISQKIRKLQRLTCMLQLIVSLIVVIKLLNSLRSYDTEEKNFPVCRMFAWLWPIDSSWDTRQRTAKNTVKSILLRFVQQTKSIKIRPDPNDVKKFTKLLSEMIKGRQKTQSANMDRNKIIREKQHLRKRSSGNVIKL